MENKFILSEGEKIRILNLHVNATKKNYLNEVDNSYYQKTNPNNINTYPPCVQNIIRKNGIENENNQYYVRGENENADKVFYNNKKYYNTTTSKFGTYSCDGENIIPDPPPGTATQTKPATDPNRIQNIANAFNSLQNNTIVSPGSSVNGMEWTNYVKKYNITSDEILQAETLAKTLKNKPAKLQSKVDNFNDVLQGKQYLHFGSNGDAVKTLQMKLKLQLPQNQYGHFGNVTKQAVINFQTNNNLKDKSGIVGPETANALQNQDSNQTTPTYADTQNLNKALSAHKYNYKSPQGNTQLNNPLQTNTVTPQTNTQVNQNTTKTN